MRRHHRASSLRAIFVPGSRADHQRRPRAAAASPCREVDDALGVPTEDSSSGQAAGGCTRRGGRPAAMRSTPIGDPSERSRRPALLRSRDRSLPARDGCVHTVDRTQRGQSTVEYLALVLLVLVACALVRFHTPVGHGGRSGAGRPDVAAATSFTIGGHRVIARVGRSWLSALPLPVLRARRPGAARQTGPVRREARRPSRTAPRHPPTAGTGRPPAALAPAAPRVLP
jgi:hypothetical protein